MKISLSSARTRKSRMLKHKYWCVCFPVDNAQDQANLGDTMGFLLAMVNPYFLDFDVPSNSILLLHEGIGQVLFGLLFGIYC